MRMATCFVCLYQKMTMHSHTMINIIVKMNKLECQPNKLNEFLSLVLERCCSPFGLVASSFRCLCYQTFLDVVLFATHFKSPEKYRYNL